MSQQKKKKKSMSNMTHHGKISRTWDLFEVFLMNRETLEF